ncbi:MAG: hypothetical protein E3K37_13230 [Candidatus Kuenenia sp.]|nr:hypothetical protein [Candidatus Kuenenia hertensis]
MRYLFLVLSTAQIWLYFGQNIATITLYFSQISTGGVAIMRRDVEKELISWKSQKVRYPLIVRGARQSGKSYLVEEFGKIYFQNNVVVNFEFQPQLKDCFQSLVPSEIINKLQLVLGVQIKVRKHPAIP